MLREPWHVDAYTLGGLYRIKLSYSVYCPHTLSVPVCLVTKKGRALSKL